MLGTFPLGTLAIGQFNDTAATALAASAGSLTLTFQSVNAAFSLAADAGAFSLTGQSSGSVVSMPAAAGVFAITGRDALFTTTLRLQADRFSGLLPAGLGFGALGESALGQVYVAQTVTSFQVAWGGVNGAFSLPAASGSFVLGGQAANLYEGVGVNPLAGSYVITGGAAAFVLIMPAQAGSYIVTSQSIDFTQFRSKIRAFPRVGRNTVSARSTGRDGIKIRSYGG